MSSSEDEVMEDEKSVEAEVVADEDGREDDEHVTDVDEGSDDGKADGEDDDDHETADGSNVAHDAGEDDEELDDGTAKSEVAEEEEEGDDGGSTPKKTPPKHSGKKGAVAGGSSRKGRAPAVKGLTIPFRAVKRTMKLDKDIATVQNEAAIVATMAAELFLKSLAKESHRTAKRHGRNTIRYEDVAEARTKKPALDFLDTLLP